MASESETQKINNFEHRQKPNEATIQSRLHFPVTRYSKLTDKLNTDLNLASFGGNVFNDFNPIVVHDDLFAPATAKHPCTDGVHNNIRYCCATAV